MPSQHYGCDLPETVLTAVAAFAATNIDDIVVLSVLFARRDERFGARQIVAGQDLGFALLIGASLAAGAGLLALPDEAVGALGLVPIAIGIRGVWRAYHGRQRHDWKGSEAVATTGGVAAITVANGADNVAIYAPLFATNGAGGVVATVIVFLGLVAVWCAVGLLIGSRPTVIRTVEWAGDYAIPVVLIALGIFILFESGLPQAMLG